MLSFLGKKALLLCILSTTFLNEAGSFRKKRIHLYVRYFDSAMLFNDGDMA
jgi:hypothetical protein